MCVYTCIHTYSYTYAHLSIPCVPPRAIHAHYSTLQHAATRCNTLQHPATRCNTLQHPATHCNTLQHIATHRNTLHHTASHCITLPHTAASSCNTPQHAVYARSTGGPRRGLQAEPVEPKYKLHKPLALSKLTTALSPRAFQNSPLFRPTSSGVGGGHRGGGSRGAAECKDFIPRSPRSQSVSPRGIH